MQNMFMNMQNQQNMMMMSNNNQPQDKPRKNNPTGEYTPGEEIETNGNDQ